MSRIFLPTRGPGDWKQLLADPEKHWVSGRSAKCLAESWEKAAPGFPAPVEQALTFSGAPELANLEILAAFPEYKVPLPGGSRASQTDLMVVAKGADGLVVIAVEGKVDETFGPTVGEKRVDASPGQTKRLDFLHRTLGLDTPVPDDIRYQLLHRTASALIVAEQYGAATAVMLVHSFSKTREGFSDYRAFAGLYGVEVEMDTVHNLGDIADARRVNLGWASDTPTSSR